MSDRHDCSPETPDETSSRVDQIAAAALRRFSRYGFKRTSMEDIAKEAGLAKATLYLHFKGKDDVFRAMIQRFGVGVEARCREVMAREAPFGEKLAALVAAHFATGYAAFGAGEHLHELKATMATLASREITEIEEIFVSLALKLIGDAETRGEITIVRAKPEQLVWTLVRAAIGAKMGTLPSQEIYEARLRDAAAVAAAAVALG